MNSSIDINKKEPITNVIGKLNIVPIVIKVVEVITIKLIIFNLSNCQSLLIDNLIYFNAKIKSKKKDCNTCKYHIFKAIKLVWIVA